MLALTLRFPAGRFHATPWDAHVNEGLVEWPPSPWRLLRAFVATWHLKARDEIPEEAVRGLVDLLSGHPPLYDLPLAALGHTRHYDPLYRVDQGKSAKIFDTFVALEPGALASVVWPTIELDSGDRQVLSTLVHRLTYLGRSESWIQARLEPDGPPPPTGFWTVPAMSQEADVSNDAESIRLLVPQDPESYTSWRAAAMEERAERERQQKAVKKGVPPHTIKLTKRDRERLRERYPKNLFDVLHADSTDLRKQGWTRPPGTNWVDYIRPRAALEAAPVARRGAGPGRLPTVARYAVASQAAPRLTEAVRVGGAVHNTLVARSDASPVFSGCNDDGTPREGHRHAYFLAEANRGQGKLSHVTVYAQEGFGGAERRALDTLTSIWGVGDYQTQLVLLGVGHSADFGGTNVEAGQSPILGTATRWRSLTPFVSTRHPKRYHDGRPKLDENGVWIGSPEHDLRRLLDAGGFPPLVSLRQRHGTDLGGKPTRWIAFRTLRLQGGGRRGPSSGVGFEIEFDRAVTGPIAVGYGAHFGLGVFVPV